jgi:hypothetical protein
MLSNIIVTSADDAISFSTKFIPKNRVKPVFKSTYTSSDGLAKSLRRHAGRYCVRVALPLWRTFVFRYCFGFRAADLDLGQRPRRDYSHTFNRIPPRSKILQFTPKKNYRHFRQYGNMPLIFKPHNGKNYHIIRQCFRIMFIFKSILYNLYCINNINRQYYAVWILIRNLWFFHFPEKICRLSRGKIKKFLVYRMFWESIKQRLLL